MYSWIHDFCITLVLSFASSLSLQDGLRSCLSESPVKLEFEANEVVDPDVTAAAAAAIEADVGMAVMEDVAEEEPMGKDRKTNLDLDLHVK